MVSFYKFDEEKDGPKYLLTIIIPLYDRHKLTDRVLRNLDEQGCNCKIVLADGSYTPFKEHIREKYTEHSKYFAENRTPRFDKIYKNLRIDYFYSGYDKNIYSFLKKMHEASERVWTPFCVICDNDDLVNLKGLEKGCRFLATNTDYSTYRNDIRTLQVSPEIKMKESLYKFDSIEQESAKDRAMYAIDHFNSFNFSIFRSGVLKAYLTLMSSLNTEGDFQFFQKGLSYFAAVAGKCKRLHNESYYYFIPGNSVIQGTGKIVKFKEWIFSPLWRISVMYTIATTCSLYKNKYGQDDITEDFSRKLIKECCDSANVNLLPEAKIKQIIIGAKSYYDEIDSRISKFYEEIMFPVRYEVLPAEKRLTHKEFLKSLNI